MDKKTDLTLHSYGENGVAFKVTVEGESDMPFWKHDLKLDAVIALLNTVDVKDFFEDNKYEEFDKYMNEIQELLNAHREF
ncbi:hypothetical protein [Planococcus faecalis]|uniref:hypothetical protein n=1 Tax=Planococcus faecalis TaxID=1598147 RepID=UPI0008D9B782|nr:hypothetical protein [Planococcus faecalis]OHX51667.1 hypothetical protein BB777_15970 [Planococcus faecalis]